MDGTLPEPPLDSSMAPLAIMEGHEKTPPHSPSGQNLVPPPDEK